VLLQELLANLIHNAIEYAGRGAHVTVRTGSDDARARLEVEDDGPGIAPEDRERVFARFERGRDARGAGSGLGLAIVRDIALRHGGTVTLHAPEGGRGLRVTVSLPRAD
jgi:two-component system sensor histidine kinase TctE